MGKASKAVNFNAKWDITNNLLYGLMPKMTGEQKEYAHKLLNEDIVFCDSKAGTGKTTIAIAIAKLLKEHGRIDRLVYIFSPVQENAMGHFPGDKEKYDRYLDPLYDALIEVGEDPMKAMSDRFGWVEARPHSFLRGCNLQSAFVLVDEAQNFTKDELKRTISRIHSESGSKAAVIGHTGQIDLKNAKESAFASCIDHFRGMDRCGIATLTERNFRGWISEHVDMW
ncbi:PhoH-like protein [compost metagenome]